MITFPPTVATCLSFAGNIPPGEVLEIDSLISEESHSLRVEIERQGGNLVSLDPDQDENLSNAEKILFGGLVAGKVQSRLIRSRLSQLTSVDPIYYRIIANNEKIPKYCYSLLIEGQLRSAWVQVTDLYTLPIPTTKLCNDQDIIDYVPGFSASNGIVSFESQTRTHPSLTEIGDQSQFYFVLLYALACFQGFPITDLTTPQNDLYCQIVKEIVKAQILVSMNLDPTVGALANAASAIELLNNFQNGEYSDTFIL